jgi:hypothetical protein
MTDILDIIVLVLIWIANGGLVVIFWLVDHILLLAAIPSFYLLIVQARQEQRLYALAAGGLSLLASLLVPPPIPLIILVMAWAGVAAIKVDKFNPDSLRWRVVGGLALYAVAALGWTAYSAYVAGLSGEQWGALFAADEAAATIAQGRSFLSTISVWGLWIIVPLGYFSLLLQGIFVHAPLAASPEKIIQTVRARGEPDSQVDSANPQSWWPFVHR